MSSVDNRIVNMEFNNKQFEEGIKTSINSLDSLKKGLNLEESGKNLSNLNKVGREFSLANISNGVDTLVSKFSALSVIGITALANITNSAVNTGRALVSSLTIGPISEGLADYNRKLTSVQTIMNATGRDIKVVSGYFSQLDTYADKTIYNLDDMTSAFAKFTNAGVGMDKSVPAIKGIANMVALAGQDANAAQIAFYNLSQSIAGGFLTTTDYRSLNLANVATKEWKEQMIQGAIAAGTLKRNSKNMYLIKGTKKAITESALFNEELSKGWATTNVLLDVLGKYGNEQTVIGKKALSAAQDIKSFGMMMETLRAQVGTGWTDTFEIIIGNLEESKALFTPLTNAIGLFIDKIAESRNLLLRTWKENGGRTATIEAFVNVFKALQAILKPIGEAFREVFPPTSGKTIADISKAIRDLTSHLIIGDGTAQAIKTTFKGLFSLFDIGLIPIKLVAGAIGLVVKAIVGNSGGLVDGLLMATSSVGNFITYIDDLIRKNNLVKVALENIGNAITMVSDGFKEASIFIGPVITNIKDSIIKFYEYLMTLISPMDTFSVTLLGTKEAFSKTGEEINTIKESLGKVGDVFKWVTSEMIKLGKAVWNFVVPVFESLKKKFDEMSLQDIGAIITGLGLLKIAKVVDNFSGILGELGDTLKAFQLKIKADALLKIAIAIGLLAASLFILSTIKMEDLTKSIGLLTVAFAELIVGLKILEKSTSTMSIFKKQTKMQLIGLGVAILVLAGAIKILSDIDSDKLQQGVMAIGALISLIAVFINTTKGGDLKASAGGLTAFAIGIMILTGALAILANMDQDKLLQGGVAIAAMITVIAAFIQNTSGGKLKESAGGMIGFATGMAILAGALALLGNLDINKLEQGGMALFTLMAVIALFIQTTNGADLAGSAGGLTGFAIGITVLVGALSILGNMDFNKLIQGGVAIFLLIDVIAAFVNLTNGADLAGSAGGLIGFAIGLTILTGAISILGNMDGKKLIQGGVAIFALMDIIAAFINVTRGGDLAGSAAGIIGFAIGLTILSGAVSILAAIDQNKIYQGVGAILAIITAIALFVNLTKEGDLKKSAAGLIGFSTGLMILAGVIAILSALNTQKLIMSSVAISMLITAIALFVNLTKAGDLKKSSAGLIAFSIGIGILAASLVMVGQLDFKQILSAGAAISVLLLTIIAFVNLTKSGDLVASAGGLIIFSGALMILTQVLITIGSVDLKTLATGIGGLAAVLIVIGLTATVLAPLTPVILGLSAAIALFGLGCLAVGAGMMLFGNGMTSLAATGSAGANVLVEAVKKVIGLIPLAMTTLAIGIINFAKVIGDGAPVIATAFMKILGSILTTIVVMTPQIMNCLAVLLTSFLNFIVLMVPRMVDAGMRLIYGILTGISNNIAGIVSAGITIMVRFINAISSKIPDVIDAAFKLIIAFINGLARAIRNNNDAIYTAVGNLVSAIIDAFLNLHTRLVSTGKNIVDGLIEGMKSKITAAANWAGSLASSIIQSAKDVLGIHSPSRAFAEIGRYSAEGFGVGLKKFSWMAEDEASAVGTNAMDSLRSAMTKVSDIISGNIDGSPTIRPVLDLSNIEAGGKEINKLFGQNRSLNLDSTISRIPNMGKTNTTDNGNNQSGSQSAQGTSVSFVQNNYSPAALSRIDIYRQTKNQISVMKGMVGVV